MPSNYEIIDEGECLGYDYAITYSPNRAATNRYRWYLSLAGETLATGTAISEEQALYQLNVAADNELNG